MAQARSSKNTTRSSQRSSKKHALPLGERQKMVAEAAYYRAEKRGFAPGDELRDWLEAENEISETVSDIH